MAIECLINGESMEIYQYHKYPRKNKLCVRQTLFPPNWAFSCGFTGGFRLPSALITTFLQQIKNESWSILLVKGTAVGFNLVASISITMGMVSDPKNGALPKGCSSGEQHGSVSGSPWRWGNS